MQTLTHLGARYRSLAEEVTADTAQKGDLASEMWEHGEMNPLKW